MFKKKISYFIIYLSLISCVLSASAQNSNSNIRKLERDLLNSKNDTNKVNNYIKAGTFYSKNYPEKANYYFEKSLSLSYKLKYIKGIASSTYNLGEFHQSKGNFKEALKYLQKSLYSYKLIHNSLGIAQVINSIGVIYMKQGNYEVANQYFNNSLKIKIKLKDRNEISKTLINIGYIYHNQANYDKALEYYFKALNLCEQTKDKKNIGACYNNIGSVFYLKGNPGKALEYYKQSLFFLKSTHNTLDIAIIYINLGIMSYSMGNYDQSIEYINNALELSNFFGNKEISSKAKFNLGIAYKEQYHYTKALSSFTESLKLSREINDQKGIAMSSCYIGEILQIQGNFDDAARYLNTSIAVSKEIKTYSVLANAYKILSLTDEKRGDTDNAFKNYKLYSEIKDSILSIESNKKISELQFKYETDKKEKEIKLLAKEKEIQELELIKKQNLLYKQQTLFFTIFILFVSISLLTYLFYRNREIKKRNNLQEELKKYMQKALSQQMNPHFVSNSLNSIQKFFLENDVEAASAYLNNFGILIRKVLNSFMAELISFEEEIEILRLYIEMEALRLNKPIKLQINKTGDFSISNIKVAPLLLQPIIENAVWHGIAHNKKDGKITISINEHYNFIECEITDNGVGRIKSNEINKKAKSADRISYGLKLVEERLKIMKTEKAIHNPIKIEDIINSEGQAIGTKITLLIPII